jgi:Leucine-rich repeat (LRR) protein
MANDNQISELDAVALCQLPMLAVLTLQNNNISTVPPELGNCVQLRLVIGSA